VLHTAGLVHGDLRAANVLVRRRQAAPAPAMPLDKSEAATAAWEVRLLDFDWAGAVGTARYPVTRNPTRRWALDSTAGGLILPGHDVEVLRAGL